MKEKQLCTALGLTRAIVKKMRENFVEGSDWVRIKSKKPKHLWEVQWTDEGIEKLKESMGVKKEEKIESPAEKKGIVKARWRNVRFLQVEIDGQIYNVLCRDNSKFNSGMTVWTKWDGSRWVVSRHPRFNGKY